MKSFDLEVAILYSQSKKFGKCFTNYSQTWHIGDKDHFDKVQIGVKEPYHVIMKFWR